MPERGSLGSTVVDRGGRVSAVEVEGSFASVILLLGCVCVWETSWCLPDKLQVNIPD